MPMIKLHLSIGFANGADRKDEEYIEDEYWDSLTDEEREDLLDEIASDWANNYIEYGAHVVEK